MKTIPAFAVAAGDKKLRCRREAARCFVFVCSWLQHLKHSLLSLVPLQIYRCIHLNSVMFSSATRWVLKTTSTLAVINKVHWCIAIVCCDKLYQTVEVETVVLMTLDQSSNLNPNNYWLKIASFPQLWGSPSKYCHNVWYEKNYNDVATRRWKFDDTLRHLDRILACDRRAFWNSIVCAMHSIVRVARWLCGWRGGCLGGAVAVWVASRPEACRLSQLQGCGFESAPLTSIA